MQLFKNRYVRFDKSNTDNNMGPNSLINIADFLNHVITVIQGADLSIECTTIELMNNGKESTKNMLGVDYEFARIIIPVLVTLVVFILGQFISWVKTKNERINELKSIKATLEYWILFVEPTIISQIKGCNDFVGDLLKSNNIQPERLQISPMLVDKLQQIELRDLIETIMLNLKGDEKTKARIIFNIVSQVEFLVKIEIFIKENYEKFQSYTMELMENWNDDFQKFNFEMNATAKNINKIEPNCQFIKDMNLICNNFLSSKGIQPLDTIFSVLIFPMEQIVDNYLKKSLKKDLAVKLAYSIDQLKIIKLKWETHKQGHIDLSYKFATQINDVYKVLKDVAFQLKKAKFKCIFMIK